MNSTKKESIAINALINEINKYDNLQENFNKRDKIPVWDGKIELYKKDSNKKDDIVGEIPVQVKGTNTKNKHNETYYDVEIVDIQAYQKTKTETIYFVVEIDKNRGTKIYYKIFDQKTIEEILQLAQNQKKKRLKFMKLKNNELVKICIEFIKQKNIYKKVEKIPEVEVYEKKSICYNYNAKYELDEIEKSNKFFYETNAYKEAKEKLEKYNIVILHGEPWVGKTSTARKIVSDYIKQDYLFVYGNVDDLPRIKEQVAVDEKIICLLDDFLGSNIKYLEKNVAESTLDKIVSIFRNSKEKKLIFTTRTYIYNNAKDLFYKFHNATKIKNEYLIDVANYTYEEKGNIFYNHMKRNNLVGTETHQKIVDDEFYADVIANDNFNPGVISLLCERLRNNNIKDIKEYIKNALNDPDQLWEEEYNKLSLYEKIILTIIVLFGVKVLESLVKEQFYTIIENENINSLDSEIFLKAIHTLSNAFVKITFNKYNEREFEVCRHSVSDYIINKIKYREINLDKYIESATYAEVLRYMNIVVENKDIKEKIALKVEKDIDKIKGFLYDEKYILFNILKRNINEKRRKILKEIIDEEFELHNPNIIMDILEYETNEFYSYTKKDFENYIINKFDIEMLYQINSILDCETFFKNLAEVLEYEKDSEYVMNYFYDIGDILINIIQEDVEENMSELLEYVAKDMNSGKSLESKKREFIEASFYDEVPDLRNVFSKKSIEELLQYLYSNCYIEVDEEALEEERERLKDNVKEEKVVLYKYKTLDMEQIKKIKEKFEEGMIVTEKDTEDELRYYSIIKDIETYGNWWIESFIWKNNFNEYNNIKLYKEFIEMKNPKDVSIDAVAEEFLNYLLFEKNKISKKAHKLLIKMAYESFQKNSYIIDKKYKKKFQNEIKELYNIGIILESNNETKFINKYIHLYIALKEFIRKDDNLLLSMAKWKSMNCIKPEDCIIDDLQHVYELYSSFKKEEFNTLYVIPSLKVFIEEVEKRCNRIGKMNVSKAILSIIQLEIYLNRAFEQESSFGYQCDYMDMVKFVTGIDIEISISLFDYGIYQKDIYEECFDEEMNIYIIEFLQAIKNKKLKEIFDRLKIWDFFYAIYNECKKALELLEEDNNINVFNIGKKKIKNKFEL